MRLRSSLRSALRCSIASLVIFGNTPFLVPFLGTPQPHFLNSVHDI